MTKERPSEFHGTDAVDYAKNLRKVRVDAVAWEIEYIDDATGERWLMDYPRGDLQGGGPPRLRRIEVAGRRPATARTSDEWKTLASAVVIWTGWRSAPQPQRNDEAVLAHFGAKMGARLLDTIRALEQDFYATDTRREAPRPEVEVAVHDFARRHSGAPRELLDALAWCYIYDFK
jgi:hypothetical protein